MPMLPSITIYGSMILNKNMMCHLTKETVGKVENASKRAGIRPAETENEEGDKKERNFWLYFAPI